MPATTTQPGDAQPSPAAARALALAEAHRKRVLDPVERFSEVIFGLVMVLTFTGALSVAESGRQEVREMLVGALGCNVAWGLVDGVMFVLGAVALRSRRALLLDGIRASDAASARSILLAARPGPVATVTPPEDADRVVARLRALPEERHRLWIEWEDLRGALASGLLVVVATLPPVIPFLLVADPGRALRISDGVAVACLFIAGYRLGAATGIRPWRLGATMVVLGSALVALTIALGG